MQNYGSKNIPNTLPIFHPCAGRHLLNASEVEEAKERIKEWKASPEAREEEESVCPIEEVGPAAHRHLSIGIIRERCTGSLFLACPLLHPS